MYRWCELQGSVLFLLFFFVFAVHKRRGKHYYRNTTERNKFLSDCKYLIRFLSHHFSSSNSKILIKLLKRRYQIKYYLGLYFCCFANLLCFPQFMDFPKNKALMRSGQFAVMIYFIYSFKK